MTGVVLAFKDFKTRLGIYGSPWVGMQNFKFLQISGKLGMLTRNTLLYNLAFIVLGVILEMGFAIILNEVVGRKFKKGLQTSIQFDISISITEIWHTGNSNTSVKKTTANFLNRYAILQDAKREKTAYDRYSISEILAERDDDDGIPA